MPLLDLFHPPISELHGWEGLHSDWASMIVHRLNLHWLPERFSATPHVRLGVAAEVDVGTMQVFAAPADRPARNGDGGTATAIKSWAPSSAPLVAEARFIEEDLIEIQVYYRSGGRKLVAAIEIVSPANKDRPESRNTFAIKCASLLAQGVSVVVVDTVTDLHANLHLALAERLNLAPEFHWESPTNLFAISYRVIQAEEKKQLCAWPYPLKVGEPLPTVPLWIAADLAVPLELEETYTDACVGLRIG